MRLCECQDNPTLISALCRLWASRPSGGAFDHPYFIGVQLNDLVPEALHSLSLFENLDGARERTQLTAAMDRINRKYGLSTLAPATMLRAVEAAPTRISFHTIPEMF
jgi:DNA polymerase-4